MPYKIQLRRGTAAQWTTANPILADGEMGIESDTRKVKVGDGTTTWTSLGYNLLGDVANNAVTEAKIADNAVTTSKIAAGAVVEADIANNAVTQAKLASTLSAVTICTSTTRPGTPFTGQTIFETNTVLLRTWNGSTWVTIGPYTPTATVQMGSSNVATSQTISSASYQDLGTVQSVTLTTGTSALISVAAMFTRPSPETNWWMGCAVSGATTIAASDELAAKGYSYSHSDLTISRSWIVTLNAGSNTFTAKFRRDSVNANAYNRSLAVVAL